MLNLSIPKVLPDVNVFNVRQENWSEDHILAHVFDMLKPFQKYGILIKRVFFEDVVYDNKSEIKKSFIKNLNIVIEYDGNEQLLCYNIPWLVDNRFYIAGNNKICLFQLFDRPLICKGLDLITVRSNITTLSIKTKKKEKYTFHVQVFNKLLPLIHILYVYLGEERLKEKFNISSTGQYEGTNDITRGLWRVVPDVVEFFTNDATDKENLFTVKGKENQKRVIEDILLITDIDIFTKKFLYTDNVLEELLYGIDKEEIDDTDYNLKRIRFSEQIVYSFLCSDFYNLLNVIRNKKGKYNVNSKCILSNLNVSPICQFDFNLNPLSELTMLTRITLSGVGGFKKDNVPPNLRDIYPSMYRKICPCDTGDRENCGTNQHLVPGIKFDEKLIFNDNRCDDIISTAVEHVPFMEHDDPTRLQMSSSQQRHAIMLKKFDTPIIQTGVESLYTQYSTFLYRSKKNGKVVHRDTNSIVIKYVDGECEAFFIGYRKLYLNICDFYHIYYDVDDDILKDAIIAESNYFKNGRLCLGKNLKTAVLAYHGYNYEDGIVISDKLVKDEMYNSTHYLDLVLEIPPNKILLNLNNDVDHYKILPDIGDILRKGEVYAKIKTIKNLVGMDVIFDEESEKYVTEDCKIVDIKIFTNEINNDLPKYKQAIHKVIEEQRKKKDRLLDNLKSYLSPDEIHIFMDKIDMYHSDKGRSSYKIKGEVINGIRIELTAFYERPITEGDKLGNRHGNKGVISIILPEEKMPLLNGQRADIVINPFGVPSRMNIGQLFELQLSQSVQDLKKNVKEMLNSGTTYELIKKYILDYIAIIDKTKDKYIVSSVKEYLAKITKQNLTNEIDDFYIIQPPFESIQKEDLDKAMLYTNTPYEYQCFDPILNKNIHNEVAFGYMYWLKLNHIAKDKMAVRGVGPYSTKTCQPLDGKSRKGGQRIGEMEIWALAAHGATENLNECLTTKSDSIKKRNRYISEKLHNDSSLLDDNDDNISQAVRLFQNNLKVLGMDYDVKEEEIRPNE
jgi:DNA-directed RNA polymerase beta subunit